MKTKYMLQMTKPHYTKLNFLCENVRSLCEAFKQKKKVLMRHFVNSASLQLLSENPFLFLYKSLVRGRLSHVPLSLLLLLKRLYSPLFGRCFILVGLLICSTTDCNQGMQREQKMVVQYSGANENTTSSLQHTFNPAILWRWSKLFLNPFIPHFDRVQV